MVKVYIKWKEEENQGSFHIIRTIIIIQKNTRNTPDFRKITFQAKRHLPSPPKSRKTQNLSETADRVCKCLGWMGSSETAVCFICFSLAPPLFITYLALESPFFQVMRLKILWKLAFKVHSCFPVMLLYLHPSIKCVYVYKHSKVIIYTLCIYLYINIYKYVHTSK